MTDKRGTAWPLGIPIQEVIEEELNRGPKGGLYLPSDGKWRLRRGVTERIAERLGIGTIGEADEERRRRSQRMMYQPTDMDDPDVLR